MKISFSSFVEATALGVTTALAVVSAQLDNVPIDIVLAIDETKEMQTFQDIVGDTVTQLFAELQATTTDYRVGLVGFGAKANNGAPRRRKVLTTDSAALATAVDNNLKTNGNSASPRRGFEAVQQIANNAVGAGASTKSLTFAEASTFPREPGFCVILISNGAPVLQPAAIVSNTKDILTREKGIFYSVSDDSNYKSLAIQTGGSHVSLLEDFTSVTLLDMVRDCVNYFIETATCAALDDPAYDYCVRSAPAVTCTNDYIDTCYCATDVEGKRVCYNDFNSFCKLKTCDNNEDCRSNEYCVLTAKSFRFKDCCDGPRCFPKCPDTPPSLASCQTLDEEYNFFADSKVRCSQVKVECYCARGANDNRFCYDYEKSECGSGTPKCSCLKICNSDGDCGSDQVCVPAFGSKKGCDKARCHPKCS